MADKLERLLSRYDELDLRSKERVLGMAEALRFAAQYRAAARNRMGRLARCLLRKRRVQSRRDCQKTIGGKKWQRKECFWECWHWR
jgi:hypothetical protein